VRYRSRDIEYPHRPDSELYYLTGLTEPDAVAVLRAGAGGDEDGKDGGDGDLVVFVAPRDAERELWAGPRPGPDGVKERLGIAEAYGLPELAARLPALLAGVQDIYFRLGEHASLERHVIEALRTARAKAARTGPGPVRIADPGLVLDDLRLRKEPVELERLRRAVAITEAGFRVLAARLAPGVGEWELQGALEGAFRSLGGDGAAFESIVASGPNACVLHYVAANRRLAAGELVLVDAGASFGLMAADVTRTFPVDGSLQGPGLDLYRVVDDARAAGVEAVAPGAHVGRVHEAVVRVLTAGLVDLGLVEGPLDAALERQAHKPFFPHQASHWLGLDVHDVGEYARAGTSRALEPGMVLTVEPGLYVREAALADAPAGARAFAGIGIRIEDDVLVTDDGRENLTAGLPTDPAALGALVGG
jgi:Xaa-Pro aminopeptidase